jgi:hypothetical protein
VTEWLFPPGQRDESHLPVELPPGDWMHGSSLGREHCNLATHLAEDHGTDPAILLAVAGPAVHGRHDGLHLVAGAWRYDLPHGPRQQDTAD